MYQHLECNNYSMVKSNNTKQSKADQPVKKRKGRPKKKASNLNSPTKHIEKDERKGRGRPRKNAQYRKPNQLSLELAKSINENQTFANTVEKDWQRDDAEEYKPETTYKKMMGYNQKVNEEMRENYEASQGLYLNNNETFVKTRRSRGLMRDEISRADPTIEERLIKIEQMISCLGVMVLALHKKPLKKNKKEMIDGFIRKGFNAGTAQTIMENMLNDTNLFEKTRKNSINFAMEGSMMSGQGSIKQ